jgi:hypothetical protein
MGVGAARYILSCGGQCPPYMANLEKGRENWPVRLLGTSSHDPSQTS